MGRGFGGFFVDDQDAAEDEAKGVGDDGGAAGGDAALGHENDEMGESRVNFLGGLEGGGDFAEEIGGEIGTIGGGIRSSTYAIGVAGAEAFSGILRRETTLATRAIAGAAAVKAARGGAWSG